MGSVTIILNKHLIIPEETSVLELQQGGAIWIKIKWANREKLSLFNVYAPTDWTLQPAFWSQLELEHHIKCLPRPDILLGNFNVTEDAIDRSPPNLNEWSAVDALRDIRMNWNIQDQ